MNDVEIQAFAEEMEPYIDEIMSELQNTDSNKYWQIQDLYGSQVLSDIEEKHIQKLAARGGPYSQDELAFIARMAGPTSDGHSFDDEDEMDDSVLDSYAEHLRNYLYTYKPEATQIDPSIDPEEEHIGIMAQDLEQVNPACVKELEDGTKVVDTNRLALMNAGAIADLAREMQEVKTLLTKLSGGQ